MAKELSKSESKLSNKTTAVLPFDIIAQITQAQSELYRERLIHELIQQNSLTVVERSKIDSILKEQKLGQTGTIDVQKAIEVGKLASAESVIIGTITGFENKIEIIARVIDTKTGLNLQSSRIEIEELTQPNIKKPSVVTKPSGSKSVIAKVEKSSEIDAKIAYSKLIRKGVSKSGRIIGLVQNTGKGILNTPNLTVNLYNSDSKIVDTIRCFGERIALEGELVPFTCYVSSFPNDFLRYEISIKKEELQFTSISLDLHCTEYKLKKAKYYGYEVFGSVVNQGENQLIYPKVIIKLFDKKKVFIGSAFGFASKEVISPKEESPFKVLISDFLINGEPEYYEVQTQAMVK